MFAHRGTSLCVAALLLILVSSGVEAQTPAPSAPRRARVPAPPPQPGDATVPQPTRLQIDVFQLQTTGEQLVRLNLDRLEGDAETGKPLAAAEVLKRLSELGTVCLALRIDNVVDLTRSSELRCGKNVPTVQSMTKKDDGASQPTVSYKDVGFTARISGSWREGTTPAVADVQYSIEVSNVAPSGVDLDSGVTLPAFTRLSLQQQVNVISGRPVLMGANDLVVAVDPKALTSVMILRLTATRLAEFERVAALQAGDQTVIEMLAIELTGDGEPLEELDAAKVAPAGADVETVLDALGKIGKAEVISRPMMLVVWPEKATITIGEQVPVVPETKTAPDGTATPTVEQRELGLKLEITGQWLDAQQAFVQVVATQTSMRKTRVKGGTELEVPTFRQLKADLRSDAVRAGERCWLIGPVWPAGDGKATRIVLGLTASRAGAGGA